MPAYDGYALGWGAGHCVLVDSFVIWPKILSSALSCVWDYNMNRGLPGFNSVGGTDMDDKIALKCEVSEGWQQAVQKAHDVTEVLSQESLSQKRLAGQRSGRPCQGTFSPAPHSACRHSQQALRSIPSAGVLLVVFRVGGCSLTQTLPVSLGVLSVLRAWNHANDKLWVD